MRGRALQSSVALNPSRAAFGCPICFEASFRRACAACSAVCVARDDSSSARIAAVWEAYALVAQAWSKAAGLSQMARMSCMKDGTPTLGSVIP